MYAPGLHNTTWLYTAQGGVKEWTKWAGGISENSTPVDHKDRMLLSFLDSLA